MKKERIITFSVILLLLGGFLIFFYFAQGKITGYATFENQPGSEGKDTYISNYSLSENNGANIFLAVGKSGANKINRGLIEFDLSDIPENSTVNSAVLTLTINSPAGQTINIHRVARSWTEGTGITAITGDGATWNNASDTQLWTTAGGDFDVTVFASNSTNVINGNLSFNLTSLVQGMVNGTWLNYGILLKHNDETVNGNDLIYSSDYPGQTFRPKLVVDYNSAPSLIILNPNNGGIYSNTNISLNFSVSDLENNLNSCWYKFEAINYSISNCRNTSFSVSGNGNYSLVVYANDSLNYLNSSSATFTIDTTAPNLTINSPSAQTYTTSTILFNATSIDATTLVDSCWYTTNSGTTNQTLSRDGTTNFYNFTNSAVTDGIYTARFYCNDSANNVNNTENVAFTIDTSVPMQGGGGGGGGSPKKLNSSATEILENNKTSNNFSSDLVNEQVEEEFIKILDVSTNNFQLGEVAVIKILVQNQQEIKIENAYASLNVYNEELVNIANLKSEDYEISELSNKEIIVFWDTKNLKEGQYTSELKVNYNEEVSTKNLNIDISKNSMIFIGTGFAISDDSDKKFNIKNLLIIVVVVFVSFLLYNLFKNKKRKK